MALGVSVNTGVGVTPVPEIETFTVAGEPLVRMARVPVFAPVVVGLKVTLMVQVSPGFNEAPQLFELIRRPAVAVWLVIAGAGLNVSTPCPLLATVTERGPLVTFRAALPKATLVGVTRSTGAGVTPVPVSETFTVAGEPLVLIAKVPVFAPLLVGVNVTLSVQLAPETTVAPQVVALMTKPAPAVWVIAETEVKFRVPCPVFEMTTVRGPLTTLRLTLEKANVVADTTSTGSGGVPVPARETLDTPPTIPLLEILRVAVSAPWACGRNATL